jgi:hypothetical protein
MGFFDKINAVITVLAVIYLLRLDNYWAYCPSATEMLAAHLKKDPSLLVNDNFLVTGHPNAAVAADALPMQFISATELPEKQDPVAAFHIQQNLNLYTMLVNARRWDALDLVFHENVWANYSSLIGTFHPLSDLQNGLQKSGLRVIS